MALALSTPDILRLLLLELFSVLVDLLPILLLFDPGILPPKTPPINPSLADFLLDFRYPSHPFF